MFDEDTREDSELNNGLRAAEISGKISLVNDELPSFFRDYVPSRSEFETPRPWTNPTKVFEAVFTSEQETDNYSYLVGSLSVSLCASGR